MNIFIDLLRGSRWFCVFCDYNCSTDFDFLLYRPRLRIFLLTKSLAVTAKHLSD